MIEIPKVITTNTTRVGGILLQHTGRYARDYPIGAYPTGDYPRGGYPIGGYLIVPQEVISQEV